MNSQPDISVIIVNLNTRDLLDACLASVAAEAESIPLEILVVDNGSTDGSAEMVRTKYAGVRLIENARNEGFARPNNMGMAAARGRFFLLLNSDTVVRPGAFRAMANVLLAYPAAGACGPKLLYPDGRLQRSAKGTPTLWTHACDMLFLDRLFPTSRLFGRGEMRYFTYGQPGEADHLMAAAFLVRRSVWEQIGGLDERFAIYYNDMDWCVRMRQAGWTIRYTPCAEVEHHLGRTVGAVNSDFRLFRMLHNNVALFYEKHYGRSAVVLYRLLVAVGFLPRYAAWTVLAFVLRTPQTRHMRRFAGKTLLYGLRFWEPVQVEEL